MVSDMEIQLDFRNEMTAKTLMYFHKSQINGFPPDYNMDFIRILGKKRVDFQLISGDFDGFSAKNGGWNSSRNSWINQHGNTYRFQA